MTSITIKQSRQNTVTVKSGAVKSLRNGPSVVRVDAKRQVQTMRAESDVLQVGTRGIQGIQGEPGLDGAGIISPIAFAWGDAPGVIFTPGEDGVLTDVRIVVTTPFNGINPAAELGTAGDTDAAFPANYSDLATAGEYAATADLPLAAGQGLLLTLAPGFGASQGAGLAYLTFLPS